MPVHSVGAATTASVSTPSSADHSQTVEEETTEAGQECPTGPHPLEGLAKVEPTSHKGKKRRKKCLKSFHKEEQGEELPSQCSQHQLFQRSINIDSRELAASGLPADMLPWIRWGQAILQTWPIITRQTGVSAKEEDITYAIATFFVEHRSSGILPEGAHPGIHFLQQFKKVAQLMNIAVDITALLEGVIMMEDTPVGDDST